MLTCNEARELMKDPMGKIPSATNFSYWISKGVGGRKLPVTRWAGRVYVDALDLVKFRKHLLGLPEPDQATAPEQPGSES
jgi:hypothetical protein